MGGLSFCLNKKQDSGEEHVQELWCWEGIQKGICIASMNLSLSSSLLGTIRVDTI